MSETPRDDLLRLAHLYGVRTAWYDVFGTHHRTSPEATLAIMRALGAPVEGLDDVPAAIGNRIEEIVARFCEPVTVAWRGRQAAAVIRFDPSEAEQLMRVTLSREPEAQTRAETGQEAEEQAADRAVRDRDLCLEWDGAPSALRSLGTTRLGRRRIAAVAFGLPEGLETGYYRLRIEHAGRQAESLVIVAPERLESLLVPGGRKERGADTDSRWGVFMPLYSLHSHESVGIGDLGDLERLLEWTAALGGSFVGTLPLLAACHAPHETPAPYAPASRLFFNEVYLDLRRLPELDLCLTARELMSSTAFTQELAKLSAHEAPHQGEVMALKRHVLELMADCFFDTGPAERRAAFLPGADDYARFRAAAEGYGRPWPNWPAEAAAGEIPNRDVPDKAYRYHLYVQYRLAGQLENLAAAGTAAGAALYLDYPVGVPPDSFDVWRYRDLFADGIGVGAPPDTFFRQGQNWGFPPLVPERERADGYGYTRSALRTHLRYAPLLRFDHIMGLTRLYWIPEGYPATDGAYVKNRADELSALLLLEADRAGAGIVGEDLGTVPRSVRTRMRRHGLHRMYIVQSELGSDSERALPEPEPVSLAALNTHDMPSFAAFWHDEDTGRLADLGHLDETAALEITRARAAARETLELWLRKEGLLDSEVLLGQGEKRLAAVMQACQRWLAGSKARLMMVSLEDLWLERRSQNVPGTGPELPNWRRRSSYSFEEFTTLPEVCTVLGEIDVLRRGEKMTPQPGDRPKTKQSNGAIKQSQKNKPKQKGKN